MLIATTAWWISTLPAFGALFLIVIGLAERYERKRAASGLVATSQAGDLWRQTQAMIATQADQLARVEDQRDRLLDRQAELLPTMAAFTTTLQGIKLTLDDVSEALQKQARP